MYLRNTMSLVLEVCYEIFELKFSKMLHSVISNKFSKMCHSIEIFEIETKLVFDNNVYKNFNKVYKKAFP